MSQNITYRKRFHSNHNRPNNTNDKNVLSPSIYSTEETSREIIACEKFLTESCDRKEYNHTSIAGIAKSLMHGVVQNYTADTTWNTSGESSFACTYIKQHSLSLRDNAAMCRGGCLTYISLAFSHVTFDQRRVNAFSEQHVVDVVPNDTSRFCSFFFLLVTTLFRCNVRHVRFIDHLPGKCMASFFQRFYSWLLIFIS